MEVDVRFCSPPFCYLTGLSCCLLMSCLVSNGREDQCFSIAGPRLGTGPWRHLYWAARDSPGICHFSFLSNFHEYMFYSGNIVRRIIFVNVSKNSDPDVGLKKLQYATRFH